MFQGFLVRILSLFIFFFAPAVFTSPQPKTLILLADHEAPPLALQANYFETVCILKNAHQKELVGNNHRKQKISLANEAFLESQQSVALTAIGRRQFLT